MKMEGNPVAETLKPSMLRVLCAVRWFSILDGFWLSTLSTLYSTAKYGLMSVFNVFSGTQILTPNEKSGVR